MVRLVLLAMLVASASPAFGAIKLVLDQENVPWWQDLPFFHRDNRTLTPDNYKRLLGAYGPDHGFYQIAQALFEDKAFSAYMQRQNGIRNNNVTIILVDDDKKSEKQKVWPHADALGRIFIGKSYFDGGGNDPAGARALVAHEFGHTQDRTFPSLWKPYGPDGSHFGDEIIKPHAAFMEGWSQYNAFMWDPSEVSSAKWMATNLRREVKPAKKGDPAYVDVKDPDYQDYLDNESVVGLVLFRIKLAHPDGEDRVRSVFKQTKNLLGFNTLLPGLLAHYVKSYPQDAALVAAALDVTTGFKAPESELRKILGAHAGDYLPAVRDRLKAAFDDPKLARIPWARPDKVLDGWLHPTPPVPQAAGSIAGGARGESDAGPQPTFNGLSQADGP
ncbi:MAG: hypothetical protein HY303_13670 [Candidatus Wallbacteria bacterium]|nr:hypothetical protein [Candidatus Wallbacteria bacterium]